MGEEDDDDGGGGKRDEENDGIGGDIDARWRNKAAAGEFYYCSVFAKITN